MRPYKQLAISVGILIVSILGLFIGVAPLVMKTISAVQEIAPLGEEVAELRAKEQALTGLDAQSLQENLGVLLSAVPEEKSIPTLFSMVEGAAGRSGVSIEDMGLSSPGSIATAAAAKQTSEEQRLGSGLLPFTLSISGTLEQVREFLTTTLSVRRLARVRTFSLVVRQDGTTRTSLDMDAFWLPFPATIGKVSQKITTLTPQQEEVIGEMRSLELFAAVTGVPIEVTIPENAAKSDPFAP
jgi:Tfp pilus assembly protein PilO